MELAGKSVVVTGGAGFIGSSLVEQLLRLGSKVTVYDNFDDFYPGKEKNLAAHSNNSNLRIVVGDIGDSSFLSAAMKGASVAFHLAAQAGVRYCMEHLDKAHSTNVTGTLNVLEAVRKNGVKKLVFASSSSVYGVPVRLPMDESHPQSPTNFYGATKLAAEKYALSYRTTYGMDVVCLRYFSVYGPRGRPDQVLAAFADSLAREKSPRIYGDGTNSRDFTYVSDVVSATVLSAMADHLDEGVYNVGFGKDFSVGFVAKLMAEILGKAISPEYVESYGGDFPRTLCSNSKAMRDLRWRPEVSFEEGIRKYVEWYLMAHPETRLPQRN